MTLRTLDNVMTIMRYLFSKKNLYPVASKVGIEIKIIDTEAYFK